MAKGSRFARLGLSSLLVAGLITSAVLGQSGSGSSAEDHMEVKFAEGLEKLGYLDLAQEQLIRTQTREYLPPRVREEATKRLARLYRTIGKAARDEGKYNEALGYYNKAVASYDDYLARMKDIVSDEEYNKLLYESGQMCAAIGRDEVAGMENTADEKERVSYKKSATLWFTSAEEKLDRLGANERSA